MRETRPWLRERLADAPWTERAPPEPAWHDRWLTGLASLGWRRAQDLGWAARLFVLLVRLHERASRRLSDEGLKESAAALRPRLLARGFTLWLTARAFALAIEATQRETGMRHYGVQIMGARVILAGRIAEMATGEGKTITAALVASAAALAGAQVHVITVNNYLARRDATRLGPVFSRLGLTTGLAAPGDDGKPVDPAVRREAYQADIVYGSNTEIAFDYLRDRIAVREGATAARAAARQVAEAAVPRPTTRGLVFAIIDEADSVLVDEARTPLIISGPPQGAAGGVGESVWLAAGLAVARRLSEGAHYTIEPDARRVTLTDAGRLVVRAADDPALEGWLRAPRAREELVRQAIAALAIQKLDRDYVVVDGKVQIVDPSTGRVMPDRQWEGGLHQLVEMKEGLEVTPRRVTLGKLTYQRLYTRYLWCGGMSGTAADVGRELRQVYELRVVRVPTHRRRRRKHWGVQLFGGQAAKWRAAARTAQRIAGRGRAVLIGTRTVADSEALAAVLTEMAVEHVVLNARQDQQEADIIAKAGLPGRITVATAMAGRGTDILLDPAVRAAGGLHVILTEFHESARVDRQLYGRSGRQGDPGSTQAIVAIDDALFRDNCGWLARAARLLTLGYEGRLPAAFAHALRFAGQKRAEALAALARQRTLADGRESDRQLAFARRPD